ncbi:MAG: hypothetical protein U9N84_05285 [Actinomycetota bacterium]|nr:hypothetical protein [Actinomycetota bacterium]
MAAVAEIAELLTDSLFAGAVTSRATWFREAPWFSASKTVPVVAGQTLWASATNETGHVQVVEQPNYFGRFERASPTGGKPVTVLRWGNTNEYPPTSIIDMQTDVGSVETAKHLAGALRQLPGTWLPHGQPESPWFIVSLPAHPGRVAADLAAAGYQGCDLIAAQFPEFPGGMRIEVAWPKSENDQIARTIRTAMNL